jgi:hypothetical protein
MEPLYRIQEGDKSGWCLPEKYIPEDIPRTPAYISKFIRKGSSRDYLDRKRSLDEFILEMLSEEQMGGLTETSSVSFPDFYLASRRTNTDVFLRADADDVSGISDCTVDTGTDTGSQVYYDFSRVYGRGVLVTDTEKFLHWYATPKDQLVIDCGHIYINLNKYQEKEGN